MFGLGLGRGMLMRLAPSLLRNRVTPGGSVFVPRGHHPHAGHPRPEAMVVKTVQLPDVTWFSPRCACAETIQMARLICVCFSSSLIPSVARLSRMVMLPGVRVRSVVSHRHSAG